MKRVHASAPKLMHAIVAEATRAIRRLFLIFSVSPSSSKRAGERRLDALPPTRSQIRFCALAVDADSAMIAVAAPDDRCAAVVTIAPVDADPAIRTGAASPINTSRADDGIGFNRQSRHQTKRQHCICDHFHFRLSLAAHSQPSRVRGGLPHIADFSGAAALNRFDVVRAPNQLPRCASAKFPAYACRSPKP